MLSENRINFVTISISSFYRDFLGGPVVKNLPSGSALTLWACVERGPEKGVALKKKKNLPSNSGDVGSHTATKTPYSHK